MSEQRYFGGYVHVPFFVGDREIDEDGDGTDSDTYVNWNVFIAGRWELNFYTTGSGEAYDLMDIYSPLPSGVKTISVAGESPRYFGMSRFARTVAENAGAGVAWCRKTSRVR